MEQFWYTKETVPEGVGSGKFTPTHIAYLAVSLLLFAALMLLYRRLSEKGRDKMLKIVAVLLIADELFKWAGLTYAGNLRVDYLPLHLCSINIILCAVYAWSKNRLIAELLYSLCLPGAMMAMLFPSWSMLPLVNFMSLHSITVHFLLMLFPLLLLAGGMKPDYRLLPKCLLCVVIAAAVMYFINKPLGTNFMFVNYAEPGTPLTLFENWFGTPGYLIGMPIMLAVLWAIMYIPWIIAGKRSAKKTAQE